MRRCFGVLLGEKGGRPGMVAALQTFGSKSQWNPHVHSLATDGLLFPGGEFHPMRLWDEETFADLRGSAAGAGSSGACDRSARLLTETFRRLVLDALVAADAGAASPSRASWARLLHKVFEVDPLLCRCGAEMKVISVITAPGLVDRLLRHVRGKNGADADTHGARDPPAA